MNSLETDFSTKEKSLESLTSQLDIVKRITKMLDVECSKLHKNVEGRLDSEFSSIEWVSSENDGIDRDLFEITLWGQEEASIPSWIRFSTQSFFFLCLITLLFFFYYFSLFFLFFLFVFGLIILVTSDKIPFQIP